MTTDYQKLFYNTKAYKLSKLQKEYQEFAKENNNLKTSEIELRFESILYDQKSALYEDVISKNGNSRSIIENRFKKDIIEKFREISDNNPYKTEMINNFINHDVIQIKSYHLKRIEENIRLEDYRFDYEYIRTATNEDFIKLIANWTAYEEFQTEIQAKPKISKSKISTEEIIQIEWQGDGKKLAELIIELKRKGWIKQWHKKTWKCSFTDTESLDDYLKPGPNKETKSEYGNVFGPDYEPAFSDIKKCKGKTHKKKKSK